jgi:hypothetical protein
MLSLSRNGGYRTPGVSLFFMLQGALLILLGVLIVLFPALLRVMVASFFILISLLMLGFGVTVRRMEGGASGASGSRFSLSGGRRVLCASL